ncbi:MAG: ion channel [Bacteroidota bacterium]
MDSLLRERFEDWFYHPRYFLLLLGLLAMIILPALAPIWRIGGLLMQLSYGLVLLLAALFTTTHYREWTAMLGLGVVNFCIFLVWDHETSWLSWVGGLTTLLFFSYVFRNLLFYILQEKEVTVNTIYASICGFLILGVVAAPLLLLLQQQLPAAFGQEAPLEFYDLLYYSFVTLTTVGYGDITPDHQLIKAISIIIAIAGQLYLTFAVAIIIGKYLAMEQSR